MAPYSFFGIIQVPVSSDIPRWFVDVTYTLFEDEAEGLPETWITPYELNGVMLYWVPPPLFFFLHGVQLIMKDFTFKVYLLNLTKGKERQLISVLLDIYVKRRKSLPISRPQESTEITTTSSEWS